MQVTLVPGPSPNASSGHTAAGSCFQLREQSSSCWELAAAQVSAVFLASCLLRALPRGAWPRKQLSPHLQEEVQPPTPAATCSGAKQPAVPACCRRRVEWLLIRPPGHARAALFRTQPAKARPGRARTPAWTGWQTHMGTQTWRESEIDRTFRSPVSNQIPTQHCCL